MNAHHLFTKFLIFLSLLSVVFLGGVLAEASDDSWLGGLESSGVDRGGELDSVPAGQSGSAPLSEADRQAMRSEITDAMLQESKEMRIETDLRIATQNLIFQQSQQVTVQAVARDPGMPGGGDGIGGRGGLAPGNGGESR